MMVPARARVGIASPSTCRRNENGVPFGFNQLLPFLVKPAFCRSSAAAWTSCFHQPKPNMRLSWLSSFGMASPHCGRTRSATSLAMLGL